MDGTRVGVIYVNYNEGELLERSLAALEAQTLRPARTIVVSNAHDDGSTDMVRERFPSVEVIEMPRPSGFAVANNVGARAADDCDWLALLNPDNYPEPDWLESLVRAACEHPGFAVFGSRLRRVREPELLDGTGDVYHVSGLAWRRDHLVPEADSPTAERPGEIFSACAAAGFYRRDAFMEVGGFDESFFIYFEDTDLAFRMRLAGHRCRYEPSAVSGHVGSVTTSRESDLQLYHLQRNMVWTWMRNMPLPLLLAYLPQHLVVNVLAAISAARDGRGATVVRAKRDAIRELPRILRERRALQARRRVGARELRQVMSRGLEPTRFGRPAPAPLRTAANRTGPAS